MKNQSNLLFHEWVIIGALSFFYVSFNVFTAERYPLPWADEIMYCDPSVNFVQGKGFVSTAWPSIHSSAFWAGNTPLHEWLLIPWLKIFGISMTAVRSINSVQIALAAIAMVWAGRRLGWLGSTASICLMIAIFFCDTGMAHISRDGRPDGVKVFFAALALLAYTLPSKYRRLALLAVGLFFGPAGLQLVTFAFVICVVAWIFLGNSFFLDGLSLGVGCLAGLILLLGFFATQGVARSFLENTLASGMTITGDLAQTILIGDEKVKSRLSGRLESIMTVYKIYMYDSLHPVLFSFCLVAAILLAFKKQLNWRDPAIASVVAAIAAPAATLLLAKYFEHYTWIGGLPLILATCLFFDRLAGLFRVFSLVFILGACALSYPVDFWQMGRERAADISRIERFVEEHILPSDRIYTDFPVYYSVKVRAEKVYFWNYASGRGLPVFPEDERESINVVLVTKESLVAELKRLGGVWEEKKAELILLTDSLRWPESSAREFVLCRRVNSGLRGDKENSIPNN